MIAAHYYHSYFPGASIGVSIFFALSGYLITKNLLRALLSWEVILRFYIRRFMRVYPPYLVTVIIIFALMNSHVGNPLKDEFVNSLPGMLTFTKNPEKFIGMGPGIFWTLYVEFWFYISIPIVILIFGKGRNLIFALTTIAGCSLACLFNVKMGGFRFSVLNNILPAEIFQWINELIFGALAAACSNLTASDKKLTMKEFTYTSWICFFFLLGISLFVSNDDRVLIWPLESTIASLVTSVWIFYWSRSAGDIPSGPIVFVGKISYSIYLIHAIPLDYMNSIPWPTINFLSLSKSWGVILGVIIVATLMHYLIELPFIRIGKILSTSREARTC